MYIKFEVSFDIPYGLIWGKDTLEVKVDNTIYWIDFEKQLTNGFDGMMLSNAEINRDRKGQTSKTHIKCAISPVENLSEDPNEIMKHYIPKVMSAVNRVLEVYRVTTDEYHVEKLRLEDIAMFRAILYLDNDKPWNSVRQFFPGGISIARYQNISGDAKELLSSGEPIIEWKTALLNAKNSLDLEDYSQAIVQANIALENFLYTHIYQRLEGKMTRSEIDEFMNGHSVCTSCSLQKDQNNPVLVLNPSPPSMYQVAKLMYNNVTGVPLPGISNTKRTEIIQNINRFRNDIVHGRNQSHIERHDAEVAVDSLETLINLSLQEQ